MSFFIDISEPFEEQEGLTSSEFVASNSFFQPLVVAQGINPPIERQELTSGDLAACNSFFRPLAGVQGLNPPIEQQELTSGDLAASNSFFRPLAGAQGLNPPIEQQELTSGDLAASNSFFRPLAGAQGLNPPIEWQELTFHECDASNSFFRPPAALQAAKDPLQPLALDKAQLPSNVLSGEENGTLGFSNDGEDHGVTFSFKYPTKMLDGPSSPNDPMKVQNLQGLAIDFEGISFFEESSTPTSGTQRRPALTVPHPGSEVSVHEPIHTPGTPVEFVESFDFPNLLNSSSSRALKPKKRIAKSPKNARVISTQAEFISTSEETGDDTDGAGCNFEPYELCPNTNPPAQYKETEIIPRKMKHDVRALLHQAVQLAELDDEPDHTPKHRSRELVELQRDIRAHAKRLLKIGAIDHSTGQPYELTFLDPQESQRFEADKKGSNGPSLNRFTIDMVSTKSKWNKRLASVFAEDFVACGYYPCDPRQATQIAKMFLVHIKTIRREVMEAREPEIDQLDKAKAAACDMRRRNLMNRRRRACEAYASDPTMLACHELLCRLPYTVCSGDESSHEGGKTRYAVTSTEWRNEKLHFIFRVLDRIYMSTRFTDANRATQGMFPHVRLPSKRRDSRGPPAGLPKNFYNPAFIENLEDYELHALALKPAVRLQFSPPMIRLSKRYTRVTSRHDRPLPPDHPSLLELELPNEYLKEDD